MGNDFESPIGKQKREVNGMSVFKPLDQTLITAVMIILVAILSWMAYTTQQLSVSMATLTAKFEAAEQKRDVNLLYMDRRLEILEKKAEENGKK